jgi:hypothetical protein
VAPGRCSLPWSKADSVVRRNSLRLPKAENWNSGYKSYSYPLRRGSRRRRDPRTLGYTYATALFPFPQNGVSCAFNDFYLPGPYPAVNPIPMFALHNNNVITPQPWGCMAQYPATPPGNGGGTCGGVNPFIPPNVVASALCTSSGTTLPPSPATPTCPLVTGNQVMAGQIDSPNLFNNSVNINGVTAAQFNMTNATRIGGLRSAEGCGMPETSAGPPVRMVRRHWASPPRDR